MHLTLRFDVVVHCPDKLSLNEVEISCRLAAYLFLDDYFGIIHYLLEVAITRHNGGNLFQKKICLLACIDTIEFLF
jgi:hypothetical protein